LKYRDAQPPQTNSSKNLDTNINQQMALLLEMSTSGNLAGK
jgi:hypothetical protein